MTGYTLVSRDSEFDDGDLERLLALRVYQAGICECGVHEAQMDDYFAIETKVCPNCKGVAQYQRVLAAEDKRAEEQLKDAPPVTLRPSDGRRLLLRQMTPLEVEARRASRPGNRGGEHGRS